MTYTPAHYLSPIDLPERTHRKFSIRHRYTKLGERIPIIGARQALLRDQKTTVVIPKEPIKIHELVEDGHGVWMTDQPEELNQIEEMLCTVRPVGRVLVGGLGLGIVAKRLTQIQWIDEVVVIERSRDVINLCKSAGYKTICSDITKYLLRCKKPFDCYLLDTWAGTGEVTWWNTVLPLRRLIRNLWGPKPIIHCWAEDIMWGQIKPKLTGSYPPHWHYKDPFRKMNEKEADYFLTGAGLPEWGLKYGKAFDSLTGN